MQLNWQQSIGIDDSFLVELNQSDDKLSNSSRLVHPSIIKPLTNLIQQAQNDNIKIALVSSYRDFERQLKIWNDKWLGERDVFSKEGDKLDTSSMSQQQKFEAIAHWSALPGLSRHHWGTDLDIFDAEVIESGYQVQLTPDEFSVGGVCHKLAQWLDANLEKFGFFRPYNFRTYKSYNKGVAAEPWHISHTKTSDAILKNFNIEACKNHLQSSNIQAKAFIIEQFEHYYKNYFYNICEVTN
jgi:LAS superfamily LD-carboxypeptidase LdcB